jgi:uncharacterized protein with HEPN domain
MSEHRDEKHYLNDILESIAAIEIYLENVNYKECALAYSLRSPLYSIKYSRS